MDTPENLIIALTKDEDLAFDEVQEARNARIAQLEQREDYTKWSIEKFCRLIERWREGYHMAGNHTTAQIYKEMLTPAEDAFKQLHPRAYQNFEKRFHEQFQ